MIVYERLEKLGKRVNCNCTFSSLFIGAINVNNGRGTEF